MNAAHASCLDGRAVHSPSITSEKTTSALLRPGPSRIGVRCRADVE